MLFGKGSLVLIRGGTRQVFELDDLTLTNAGLNVSSSFEELQWGRVLTLTLMAEDTVELVSFSLQANPEVAREARMLVNGFQAWTDSRELGAEDRLPALNMMARPLLTPYGDYGLTGYTGSRGRLHSWSWTAFRETGVYTLIGSSADDCGYTRFEYDYGKGMLDIVRDVAGTITRHFELLRLYIGRGEERLVWDEYCATLPGEKVSARRRTGWTSWYNYYTHIDQGVIDDNMEAISSSGLPFEVFQIDDGWQRFIGDWLHPNHKFPEGMKPLAQRISERGLIPGLWLAPFICEKKSFIWEQHYEWLLKDEKGNPVRAGWNPGWSGWFYALDFYAPGFQDWLEKVFRTALGEWGFAMLKLDFLYAVALCPHGGRNRGQIMAEALSFIRRVCGDKILLGCGVPLGVAQGKVDYCRIGGDVAPYWEDRFLKTINYRERVSTINSLYSTLHRSVLDRRFFRNDPDVFLLRDGQRGRNLNKMSRDQRQTLFMLNNLLGGLVFFSDDIANYTKEQRLQLAEMFPSRETEVMALKGYGQGYEVTFAVGNEEYVLASNLSGYAQRYTVPEGVWFNPEMFVQHGGCTIVFRPHQSICWRRVKPQDNAPYILGASGHLWPGAQVEELAGTDEGCVLSLLSHAAAHSKVWIAVPPAEYFAVNGCLYPVQKKDGCYYVVVDT
jgi:alpha-galactosidase